MNTKVFYVEHNKMLTIHSIKLKNTFKC